jgi:hypothetical protein
MKIKNLLLFAAAASLSVSALAQDLATGETVDANIYQPTQDHFFVRGNYDDRGKEMETNKVSFKGGSPQLVWIYLDDDEIYLNEKVQALPPIPYDNKGNLYKEITYNSFETDIYLPQSIEMVQFEDEEGELFDWQKGNRMPNTAQFKFSEGEPKVIDGLNYRSYKLLCFNMSEFGSHFSSKTAKAYENNGALKKDASLFGIYLQNNNQEMAEGRLDQDMIIGNTLLMTRETDIAGWEPNDAVFFYGTGGNNGDNRFMMYNRVGLWGSTNVIENLAEKTVSSVKYINIAGMQSNEPFEGVNIEVVTYNDGTTHTSKEIK